MNLVRTAAFITVLVLTAACDDDKDRSSGGADGASDP
jgi:hypothetical protein